MRAALLALLLFPAVAAAQMLDDAAVRLRADAYLKAWTAPLGRPVEWRDTESGDHGRIVPLREHKQGDGLCRDMEETLTVQGEARSGKAMGCRDAGQSWHVVSATPGTIDEGSAAAADVPADLPPYHPPADISADPPKKDATAGMVIRVRPPGSSKTATPEIYLSVPPPPTGN